MKSLLLNIAKAIISGSVLGLATRIISRGIRVVANRIANYLYDLGYYRAANSVRHIARYIVNLGQQVMSFYDVYGAYDAVVNVDAVVDEVEIDGYRYSLVESELVY